MRALIIVALSFVSMLAFSTFVKAQTGSALTSSVEWSPTGDHIATGASDGVRIYDTQFNEITLFDVDYARGLAWSPDGTKLAFAHVLFDDVSQLPIALVEIWDMVSGSYTIPPFKIRNGGPLSWSPDGTQLAVGDTAIATEPDFKINYLGSGLPVLDTTTGQVLREITTGGLTSVTDLSWSPTGEYVAVTDSITLSLWDTSSETADFVTETQQLRAGEFAWSPDGLQVAFISTTGITVWDIQARGVALTINAEGIILDDIDWQGDVIAAIDFVSEGQQFIRAWQASSGDLLTEIQETDVIYSVALSPDGSQLVYGGANSLLEVISVPVAVAAQGLSQYVSGISWSPDGTYIAVGSDQTIFIYDANLNLITQTNDPLAGTFIAWSPDSTRIAYTAVSSAGSFIKVFDVGTSTITTQITGFAPPAADVASLDWNPQGTEIVHSNGQVTVWDAQTGSLVKTLEHGVMRAQAAAWSPDGQLIAAAVADNDRQIVVWDYASGTVLKRLMGVEPYLLVAWTQDSQQVVATTINNIEIWDVVNEQIISTIPNNGGIIILTLDVRNGVIVTASPLTDGLTRVSAWDLATGSLLYTIDASLDVFPGLALSPDGTMAIYHDTNLGLVIEDVPDVVSCDSTPTDTPMLISAIDTANGTPEPDTICLAESGTYTFTAAYGCSNALPKITSDITIEGNNATLTRNDQ